MSISLVSTSRSLHKPASTSKVLLHPSETVPLRTLLDMEWSLLELYANGFPQSNVNTYRTIIIIDRIALAKQEDNALAIKKLLMLVRIRDGTIPIPESELESNVPESSHLWLGCTMHNYMKVSAIYL